MRILALIPGDIGTQFLFFPTLETLKKQYPNAAIDVLVEPGSKQAYRVCKNVDDVLVFDFKDRNSFAEYLNLLGTIRDREYDVLISLKTSWRIKLLLWLNGIPKRIGYQDDSALYLSNTVVRKSEQYQAQMYHDLLTGLGIQAACPPLTINVPTVDISWAESEQQRLAMSDSGYIILCDEPTASQTDSAYPITSWQKIIEDIERRETGLSIVLLQTERNQAWVTKLISANGTLKAIAPPDIGKMAAIVAGANLILCTTSTPMYLAVAAETYAFVLTTEQESKLVLPPKDNCKAIASKTDNLGDIPPEVAIEQLWQE